MHGADAAAAKRSGSDTASCSPRRVAPGAARAARRRRVACTDSTGPASASCRSMSWLASSNRMPPLWRGSANHDPAAAAARSARGRLGRAEAAAHEQPGRAPASAARAAATTSRLRHW